MFKIPGNIPIQIYPVFFLVVFALSAINANFEPTLMLVWAFVIFVSLIVHEMGHALTAVAFGQRASIDLVGFGGVTRRQGPPLKPLKEFIIVFNGPLAGFILGLACLMVLQYFGTQLPVLLQNTLQVGYFANFFWTVVNLLPVHPLDGGQLLRITLEGFFGLRGLKTALFISFLFGVLLSVYFFAIGQQIIGIFFMIFTYESYRAWRSSLSMTSQDSDRALQQFFKSAEKDFHKGHLSYAQEKLNAVRKQAGEGVLHKSATNLLAQILHAQGHDSEAYDMLYPTRNTLSTEHLTLLHQLAYSQNHFQEAIKIGNTLYQDHPTDSVALTNALSHAHRGEAHAAVGWLQCAIKNGLPNVKEVLQKEDFNPIRQDPLFNSFTVSIEKGG
ncbi:MAG: M50 family metallopeptidase [Parachlamydiaceae bacterium]|nr:M50 family metallopeptidase [Parachlamydiaceae bacterium]